MRHQPTRRELLLTSTALALGAAALPGAGARPAQAAEPARGGVLIAAFSADPAGFDPARGPSGMSHVVIEQVYSTLMALDADAVPYPELAESVEESADGLTYTFKLRPGITFHDGSAMTSADVVASFDRYARLGIERAILANVERWAAPDDLTFVITMKVAQPTFLQDLSSFSVPIVIVPAETAGAEALRLEPVGTGPFRYVEFIPDSHVSLARFEDYQPNTAYTDRIGFGGYKVAWVDSVSFCIVTEPGSRVAGLETGELDAVEDVPQASVERLQANPAVRIVPYENFWLHIATPNFDKAPTDNPLVRRAIATALDMGEIMLVATDGAYNTNFGFQTANRRRLRRRRQRGLQRQGQGEGQGAARRGRLCR